MLSARRMPGGEDHLVKTAAQEALGTLALAQIEPRRRTSLPFGEVQRRVSWNSSLARICLGKVELAADFAFA